MKVYRIHIESWTASFRYPNMISGFQPTLDAPPYSTINGLISAAKGDYFKPENEKIGFVFRADGKNIDLETIYQMGKSLSGIKSNVIKREFFSYPELFIYTDSQEIASYFSKPVFPLLMGRSNDLAGVKHIEAIDIEEKSELTNLKGTILPFKLGFMAGSIQALPRYFSNSIPRQNIDTQPYYIFSKDHDQKGQVVNAPGFSDKNEDLGIDWDVYWQD